MKKLCCFPCAETPSVDLDIRCNSTCCAANKIERRKCKSKDNLKDETDIRKETDKHQASEKSKATVL